MTHKSTALGLALFAALAATQVVAQESHEKARAEKIIDGPRIEQVANTEATIAWTTNVGGSSVIHYGTEPNRLNEMAESKYADNDKNPKYQTHRVELHNLKPNTTYYYKVISGQGEGTGTEADSRVEQFRTR
jgi:phosphodiesterase/alkaline phosphatase D-like protein